MRPLSNLYHLQVIDGDEYGSAPVDLDEWASAGKGMESAHRDPIWLGILMTTGFGNFEINGMM